VNKPVKRADPDKSNKTLFFFFGGVVGGSLNCGHLHSGDELELRPEEKSRPAGWPKWVPITTTITKIFAGISEVEEVYPAVLLALVQCLIPRSQRVDALVGQVAGLPGSMPPR